MDADDDWDWDMVVDDNWDWDVVADDDWDWEGDTDDDWDWDWNNWDWDGDTDNDYWDADDWDADDWEAGVSIIADEDTAGWSEVGDSVGKWSSAKSSKKDGSLLS